MRIPPALPDPAITRGARALHVYEQLREQIVRGVMAPGARVVEQEIAERMGVGRTPVREALQLLEREKLVVGAPAARRQLSVAPLREDDAEELFALVGELEGVALRCLSRQDPRERATIAAAAREANRRFGAVVSRVPLDPEAAFLASKAFHAAATDRLAGARLAWLLSLVRPQVDRYEWYCGVALQGELGVAIDEHGAVVRALEAGDATAAEAAIRANWRNAGIRLGAAIRRAAGRRPGPASPPHD
ncbi:MAG: GntR family transcriptional regulator [Longimicrobiaceae bacterium]